ncbi:hypothetical protein DPPLL_24860 [Desulfofustis limnaeus]|uniref:4Fe-4S ferredoxin-type domain-containing protein n=1 Tax=Desulfofustis limnaeus TaxID=2740163 RepID=A0ABN6M5H1_9BACT|nr:hypothetical protein DPPLL_24860 [Desulfofustis limnaeus]
MRLKSGGRSGHLARIFHNPELPSLTDYYEPFTYRYGDLTTAAAGDDQPTARPVSLITGKSITIEGGPNWDDDLSGSHLYARNDPGIEQLTETERAQVLAIERIVFFHLPRICNHCLNAACVAACPSGAIYKRGEDGIVLINQDKCRGWRMCVSACPYKKTYYNWTSGKSEKCILCYPRQEVGEAPACFHSCVGRIRYLGVLLYDADQIEAAAGKPADQLAAAQRDLLLDPHDPVVRRQAHQDGVTEQVIEAARQSPVFRFVKEWSLALPLHPEFRTVPMLFYVPPLLPVLAMAEQGKQRPQATFFTSLENTRLPLRYLAHLFAGGNEREVEAVYQKLLAVRLQRRHLEVGDISPRDVQQATENAGLTAEQLDEIYRITALADMKERIHVPPMLREQTVEALRDPHQHRQEMGFGYRRPPKRRW